MIDKLEMFIALANERHFGRAAEVCAISQPALSMQIKELEAGLGSALFDRGARAVRLTSFGEEFAARAREILRLVDELEDAARIGRDQMAGRLRLGVIPTVAPYLLPAAMVSAIIGFAGVFVARSLSEQAAYAVIGSTGTLLIAVAGWSADTLGAGLYYLAHSTLAGAALFLVADVAARRRGS